MKTNPFDIGLGNLFLSIYGEILENFYEEEYYYEILNQCLAEYCLYRKGDGFNTADIRFGIY